MTKAELGGRDNNYKARTYRDTIEIMKNRVKAVSFESETIFCFRFKNLKQLKQRCEEEKVANTTQPGWLHKPL